MRYGYARVSSASQSLEDQTAKLRAAGCDVVRAEKVSGKSTDGRDELRVLLDFLHPGDEVFVTRIDRIARSIRDLLSIVEEIKTRGAVLRATEQPIDASSPAGQAFLSMLGVFAEFERQLILERQRDGLARARAAKKSLGGRTPTIPRKEVWALLAEGVAVREIARRLRIGQASVYRILNEAKAKAPVAAPLAPPIA